MGPRTGRNSVKQHKGARSNGARKECYQHVDEKKMPSNPPGVSPAQPDDSFELYDLRVEVVCPEGERIMCGAKEGDFFTLEGEMMHLPPGQGISIYSLGEFDG